METEDKSVAFLHRVSHKSKGPDFITAGKLNSCALGEIYYARYKNSNEALVLKTIFLNDQNVWAVVKNTNKTTLRNICFQNILYISENKNDAREWCETWSPDSSVCKLIWTYEKESRDGAEKIFKVNEFINEGIVGLLLSKCIALPHIVRVKEFWINDDAEGNILQEYGGVSMLKNMVNLSLPEFKSIVMQSLITLGICQNQMYFKHHDLHLENVFINELRDQMHNGDKLSKSSTWSYTLKKSDGSEFVMTIPHENKLCKIGDFGLSSVTDMTTKIRYERVDMWNLDGAEVEWGEWSGHSKGLYDAVVFLSKFFLKDESQLCPPDCLKWAKSAYGILRDVYNVKCSNIGRPFRGHEGQATINDFLSLDFFQEFKSETKMLII